MAGEIDFIWSAVLSLLGQSAVVGAASSDARDNVDQTP